jgi:Na+/H+ antiporter NhaD/arsenite permease-like protein
LRCGKAGGGAAHVARFGERGRALISTAAGVVILVTDLSGLLRASHHKVAYNQALTRGIVAGFIRLTVISIHFYTHVKVTPGATAKEGIHDAYEAARA